MTQLEFERKAKHIVAECDGGDDEDVSMVWFTYLLGNMKALVITKWTRGRRYYEVTYNANGDEFYVDWYDKVNNELIKNGEV